MFNANDPPDTYKKFKRSVIKSIETIDVEEDEIWPPALFVVQRNGDAFVSHLNKIANEDDEEIDFEHVLTVAVPHLIKSNSGKFFALVFPGAHREDLEDEEGKEALILLMGCIDETDMLIAEIDRENGEAELDTWDRLNPLNFSELVVPIRRAITLQG